MTTLESDYLISDVNEGACRMYFNSLPVPDSPGALKNIPKRILYALVLVLEVYDMCTENAWINGGQ